MQMHILYLEYYCIHLISIVYLIRTKQEASVVFFGSQGKHAETRRQRLLMLTRKRLKATEHPPRSKHFHCLCPN